MYSWAGMCVYMCILSQKKHQNDENLFKGTVRRDLSGVKSGINR